MALCILAQIRRAPTQLPPPPLPGHCSHAAAPEGQCESQGERHGESQGPGAAGSQALAKCAVVQGEHSPEESVAGAGAAEHLIDTPFYRLSTADPDMYPMSQHGHHTRKSKAELSPV